MIFSMIHLVLISVIILAPWFLYKNPSRRMILFYQRMSYSTHCRLFYGKILLLTLTIVHTSHVQSRCDFGLHSSGSRLLSFKSAGG